MVSPSQLVAFAALAFLMVIVPGPSVLFTISRALTVGRRDALLTVVGNATGVYLQVIGVAFGLGVIVERSTAVFTTVKLLGAAYLVYLGVQAIRKRRALVDAFGTKVAGTPGRTLAVLRDGVVVGFCNPKSIVFLAAVLPQFVNHGAGAVPRQILVLGLAIPLFALILDSAWALAATTARTWFARSPRRIAAVGGTSGAVLIGLGASLALTGRKD